MATLLGPTALHHMTLSQAHTSRPFVLPPPDLGPVRKGLQKAFDFAAIVCLFGAVALAAAGREVPPTPRRRRAGADEPAQEAVAETEPLLVS